MMMPYIWIFLQVIIGYSLVFPLILLLFSKFHKPPPAKPSDASIEIDYAIIVTAFEQTNLLPDVVASILNLDYSNYLIYVVADNCDDNSLNFLDEKVILLRPENVIASNIGSHFYAIKHFERNHERLTIIDSDNIVSPNFIKELNIYFDQGFKSVQGLRKPKNLNTSLAAIDALRDLYYHYYDGNALFLAGSSSTLSGSGMAFTVELFEHCLKDYAIKGAGFDKVLQYEIVRRDLRIAFAREAVVYDEKTTISDQLIKQRSRWILTWFKYFSFGFILLGKGIQKFSINQLLFGLILLRPPLFIFLILAAICLITAAWTSVWGAVIWGIAFLCFIISIFIPLCEHGIDKRIHQSIIYIPQFVFYQLIALLRINSVAKDSVSTKHFYSSNERDKI